jgi:hypothetical protein
LGKIAQGELDPESGGALGIVGQQTAIDGILLCVRCSKKEQPQPDIKKIFHGDKSTPSYIRVVAKNK